MSIVAEAIGGDERLPMGRESIGGRKKKNKRQPCWEHSAVVVT
jgi:hypothetical protein